MKSHKTPWSIPGPFLLGVIINPSLWGVLALASTTQGKTNCLPGPSRWTDDQSEARFCPPRLS